MELSWKKSTGSSPRYATHELVSSATRLRKINEVGPESLPRDTRGDTCFLPRLAA
ncbi:hypothetical protein Hanom_Chr00s050087g01779601 [Helianthus anomalus]